MRAAIRLTFKVHGRAKRFRVLLTGPNRQRVD